MKGNRATRPSFISNEELNLIFFGGKGGVGKTTCAAATALEKANQDKKTLIMSINPAHSLSGIFGCPIGNKITEIDNNLWGLEVNAEELLEDYKNRNIAYIRTVVERGTYIDAESLNELVNLSLPGMDEVIGLLKLIDISNEGKYDVLVVDTAATGHTIRLFHLPKLIDDFYDILGMMQEKYSYIGMRFTGRRGFDAVDEWLKKQKEEAKKLKPLITSRRTEFVLVTIPESMVVQETELLNEEMGNRGINVRNIIVNMVYQSEECAFCKERKRESDKYVQQIESLFHEYQITKVPFFPEGVRGMKDVVEFTKFLSGEA